MNDFKVLNKKFKMEDENFLIDIQTKDKNKLVTAYYYEKENKIYGEIILSKN